MGGGSMSHAKSAKSAKGAAGVREGRAHAETRRRGGLGGGGFCTKGQKGNKGGGWSAGGRSALKTMKTAPRTWKRGRDADVQSGRGRPARLLSTSRPQGASLWETKRTKRMTKQAVDKKGRQFRQFFLRQRSDELRVTSLRGRCQI